MGDERAGKVKGIGRVKDNTRTPRTRPEQKTIYGHSKNKDRDKLWKMRTKKD